LNRDWAVLGFDVGDRVRFWQAAGSVVDDWKSELSGVTMF